MVVPTGFEWIQVLQGIDAIDAQIALTAAVLVLAAVLARLVAPALVAWTRGAFDRLMEQEDLRGAVGTVRRYTPWWASMRIVVWFLQVAVVVLTAMALLAIWGQLDLALAVLGVLSISVPALIRIGLTVLLFVAALVAIDIVDTWLSGVTERSERFSQHQEEVAFRVLQIVTLAGASLVVLSIWGVDLGGLLIGAGFLGIVAGMAAQQTLGSLIAGFVLMFSRPFEIGDWVAIGDHEGIVSEITIVNTRLENFDGEFVVLPNDKVGNATIVNRSKKGRLRLRVEVGIDYAADPERAKALAEETLKETDAILSVPRPQAVATRMGDSAVVLELRFWIDKPSARRRAMATSTALREVKAAYEEAGITIPFPQRELSGRDEEGGFRVVGVDSPGTD
jgi:small-conductance mechanosensitive channel